jgi:hypothetical protein
VAERRCLGGSRSENHGLDPSRHRQRTGTVTLFSLDKQKESEEMRVEMKWASFGIALFIWHVYCDDFTSCQLLIEFIYSI